MGNAHAVLQNLVDGGSFPWSLFVAELRKVDLADDVPGGQADGESAGLLTFRMPTHAIREDAQTHGHGRQSVLRQSKLKRQDGIFVSVAYPTWIGSHTNQEL